VDVWQDRAGRSAVVGVLHLLLRFREEAGLPAAVQQELHTDTQMPVTTVTMKSPLLFLVLQRRFASSQRQKLAA
jgi:hypothetical protein